MPLAKLLLSYNFFEEIIEFIKNYWNKEKYFFPGHCFTYPQMNQSLKWQIDYIVIEKNKPTSKKWRNC